jgi:hypothetical protein
VTESILTTLNLPGGQTEQVVTTVSPNAQAVTTDTLNGQLSQIVLQAILAGTAALPTTITLNAPESLAGGSWYISGQITGPNAAGVTVTFSGIPSVEGQTCTTAADGTFQLVFEPSTNGNDDGAIVVTATVNGQTITTFATICPSGR